jgi:ACS family glucarate transporter-like MFS transporter
VILGILAVAGFVAYVLRINVSIAGEGMAAALGLSRLELGMVLAAFAWGYGLFQFPGGVFGERLGARRTLTLIAVIWGILTALTGIVPGPTLLPPAVVLGCLVALRFLMGAVQAPFYPVTGGGTTCSWFPVSGWAFPTGLQNFGLTLGSAATGPLVAWIMERWGWRASFLAIAPSAFLLAAVWWWYGRDTPAEHPGVGAAELRLINANRGDRASTQEAAAWRLVLRNREVRLLTASYFCSNYLFYFFFNWLFVYLVENRGLRVLEGGLLSAAPWLTGGVGAVVGGLACDRLTRRVGLRWGYACLPLLGLIVSGALVFFAAKAQDAHLAVVYLSLCLGFQQLTEGPFWAATIAVSGRHASAACGVLNTGGNVVGGVVALSVPLTVDAVGWVPALATACAFAMAGAALWLWIRADRPLAA